MYKVAKAEKKNEEKDLATDIPVSVLQDTTVSVLEAIVEYFKEAKGMRYREIAKLLKRDERNIWTVYHRAKAKRKNAKKY